MVDVNPIAAEYRRVISESFYELQSLYPDLDWSGLDQLMEDEEYYAIEQLIVAIPEHLPAHIYERLRELYMSDLPFFQHSLDELVSVRKIQEPSPDAGSEDAES